MEPRVASPFLFGVYGLRPNKETVALFKRTRACGVLLLARNIESPAQVKAYAEELTQRVGRPILFTIDHEGGWVLRFESGLTPFPGNAALGRAGDPRLAYETGRQMALELRELGIHVNLAPVVDVLTGRYNPGIGIRSFGSDPALVGELGAAMIRGMQDHGVHACAKHFPGKGAASVDAHVERPTIRLPRGEFFRDHVAPFAAAARAGVSSVMTSHVRYPSLDSAIATFSTKITRDLLRKRLGFTGVIMADDLCMGAVTGREPVQLAAVKALAAGHDLLIIAHDRQAQEESAEILEAAVQDGSVDRADLDASYRRIARLFKRGSRERPRPDHGAALAARAAKAAVVVREGALPLPLPPSEEPLLVIFPDFEQVKHRFTFEGGPRGPERFLRRRLAAWGPAKVALAPVESTALGALPRDIRKASRVLFFCFEAMRFPGQKAVLGALKDAGAADRTAACLIRNPWDRDWLPKSMTTIDPAGYRTCQLSAALNEVLS